MTDIISAIDSATGCHQCGNPLGSSPSSDFCSEFCQRDWHLSRAEIGTVYAQVPLRPEPHPTSGDFVGALRALYRGI